MAARRRLRAFAVSFALAAAVAEPAVAADETFSIAGRISPAMQYRLRIDYVTSLNDPACQSYDFITGMRDPDLESRYERPTLAGGRHSLSISLARPDGAGTCNWRPSVIFLCVGPRGAADDAEACRALFLIAKDAGPPPAAVFLTCEPKTWVCVDPQGREPAQQASGFGQPITVDLSVGPLPPAARP